MFTENHQGTNYPKLKVYLHNNDANGCYPQPDNLVPSTLQ